MEISAKLQPLKFLPENSYYSENQARFSLEEAIEVLLWVENNQARFSLEEAIEVLLWVENVTGLPYACDPTTCRSAADVAELLKDGVHLCKLINRLLDNGSRAPYNPKPKMPFQKMENISNFLEACKAYGVAEISCFQTCYKVIECLRSLAAVVTLFTSFQCSLTDKK
ncbi:unnamed protein product, partial [Strongylus vulgaris]